MSKRRSKAIIIAQILEICRDGATKTKIVYTSNVSFKNVTSYLIILIKDGLMEKTETKPIKYKTSKKGLKALEKIEMLQNIISEYDS